MSSNLVTVVRNLQQRKGRKRSPLAVAEGVRLVEEALLAGIRVEGVLVEAGFGDAPREAALLADLGRHAVAVEEVAAREFGALADTDTPQGILAVVEPRAWTTRDLRPAAHAPVVVLDGLQDPGNVGTVLRTAFALGAAGAVLLKGTADVTHPKVLRAGMGATFRLPSVAMDVDGLTNWLAAEQVTLWVTAAEGTALGRVPAPERLAIGLGNEGAGVSAAVKALAAERVAISLARGAESLNVAVAAGIVLYEVTRGS